MYGYAGKIAYIDLGKGKCSFIEEDRSFQRAFLGGRGFTSKLLFDAVNPSVSPFDPTNCITLALGPLAGTMSPSSGRFTVATKSPLTGILGDANSGGHFGAELRYAGFDGLVITGRSKEPCYIFIEDGKIEIRSAKDCWGKRVSFTDKILKEDIGDNEAHVLSIGPAGENMVLYAALINDVHRAAARCGIGAVFGSKHLKSIVVRGTQGVEIASYESFMEALELAYDAIYNDPIYPTLSELGTPFLMDSAQQDGGLATRNNQSGVFEKYEDISQAAYTKKYKMRSFACFSCPIHCSNVSKVLLDDGRRIVTEGPEYESLVCLGSKCGISSLPTIIEANKLCNELGIDTISCGDAISLAMELWEKGILTSKDTGGMEIGWGNEELLLQLIESIGNVDGFGAFLAKGVRRMSESLGPQAERLALHVKGMGVPAFDGRAAKGFALGWAVSTRGADHLRALPNFELLGFTAKESEERFGSPYACDPYEERGKASLVYWHENFSAAVDSAEMCKYETFSTYAVTPAMLSSLINAVVGSTITESQLLQIGERIVNLEKAMNISFAGVQRDTLPHKILHEPLPSGPAKGNVVDLDKMIGEYYSLRGWDEQGVPTRRILSSLGLKKESARLSSII